MPDIDTMFESVSRLAGDLAGVFEFDGETGYFYLYKTTGPEGEKIVDAISVLTGAPDFIESDVSIRWNLQETSVGLFIKGKLWAVFDTATGLKFGGDYKANATPEIPRAIERSF